MESTLYEKTKDIERASKTLRGLDSSIDIFRLQRKLFQKYENNPVFYDAMQGKQSIEESVEELGKVNKGIRKILPWKINKEHNKRVKRLGELVSEPYHLYTSGIFEPDNFITVGSVAIGVCFGVSYLLGGISMIDNSLMGNSMSTAEIQQTMQTFGVLFPTITSVMAAPVTALLSTTLRFKELPTGEAKYLDGIVQEFYK